MSEKLKKALKSKNATKESQAKRVKSQKRSNSVRYFLSSPYLNVVALALLFVAVFAGMRLFVARQNPAQIKFVERDGAGEKAENEISSQIRPAPEIFRGEVYETSIRLRETGALGMAISLAVFAEFAERKSIPANLETVLSSVERQGLWPPEMIFKNGEISSPSSLLLVRYRAQPLAFEILSRPKRAGGQSPALMLRFPVAFRDKRTITYFQSPVAITAVSTPEPFAPLDRIVAAGWTLEQWRGELLPGGEQSVRLLEEEKRLLSETTNR